MTTEQMYEHMVMPGVTGKLEWIRHVGELEGEKLYQATHYWLFGE